jgi:hypothetical protein
MDFTRFSSCSGVSPVIPSIVIAIFMSNMPYREDIAPRHVNYTIIDCSLSLLTNNYSDPVDRQPGTRPFIYIGKYLTSE